MNSRTSQPFRSSFDDKRDEFSRGVDKAKSTAHDTAEAGSRTLKAATDKASGLASRVGDSAAEMADQAMDTASDMVERGSEYARAGSRQVREYASELEDVGRRNPLATLAATLMVGVVIGYVARGRH